MLLITGCGASNPPSDYRDGIKNVILIAVDTLAAKNLSYMGYERETSPFLNEFSKRCVVFKSAYTPKALTLPSFTSIFSGLHPVSHNVQRNGVEIPEDVHFLTENFQDSGFRTVGFTASKVISGRYGMDKGFSDYDDTIRFEVPADRINRNVGSFLRGDQSEGRLRWEGEEEPLFLLIHYFDPHTDYNPAVVYFEEFADPEYEGRVTGAASVFSRYNQGKIRFDESDLKHTRDLYDAEIRTLDDFLRQLISLLEENGLMDNSAIVITADHGENLGEHKYITHGHPYEAGLHVPLMFHFPRDAGAGIEIDSLVETTDIMPTLLELAGIEIPGGLDGHSIQSLMIDQSDPENVGREFLLACGGRGQDRERTYSILDGRHRLIYNIVWSTESLLYDLENDPHEEIDLAGENPELVGQLEALVEVMSAGEDMSVPVEMDPETEEMLRSLGYI